MSDEAAVAEKLEEPEVNTEESEGFEVVIGDDETPASNSVPLSTHVKQKQKWKQRAREAEQEAREAQALKQENELLRMQLEQQSPKQRTIPNLDEIDDPAERAEALRKYIAEETSAQVEQRVSKLQPKDEPEPQLADEKALDAHYERARKLKVDDFDAAEDEVIAALGKDAARQIIEHYDNSEAIMWALGKNPSKLREFQDKLHSNPVRMLKELTEFASTLRLKPKGKAPEPDSVESGVSGGGNMQAQLDALRKRVSEGKAPMSDVLKFKKEAKAAGVTLV